MSFSQCANNVKKRFLKASFRAQSLMGFKWFRRVELAIKLIKMVEFRMVLNGDSDAVDAAVSQAIQ